MASFTQSGTATFPIDGVAQLFRFTVTTTTNEKLRVWLEYATTKEQWQTRELAMEDFVTTESALPQAKAKDYAMRVVDCLEPTTDGFCPTRSLSSPLGDGSRQLSVSSPFLAIKSRPVLKYSFHLSAVKRDPMELLSARLNGMQALVKTTADEVAMLRLENEKLEDRLDKAKYEHRLVKDDIEQLKTQHDQEKTVMRDELSKLRWENRSLEAALNTANAETCAIREDVAHLQKQMKELLPANTQRGFGFGFGR